MKILKRCGWLAAAMTMFALSANAEPSTDAKSGDWQIVIGAGAFYAPVFEGSDTSSVSPVPMIDISWRDRVFLNPVDGLGVHVYRGDQLTVSTSLGYEFGRDQGDNSHLAGLGNVDGAATLSLAASYDIGPFSPFAELKRHLGGTNGFQAELGVEAAVPISVLLGERQFRNMNAVAAHVRNRTMLMAGISADWASGNYMRDYFGVNAAQSAASGLNQFSAGAGFKSLNASMGVMVPLGKHVMLNGNVGYSRLIGDAADSPISQRNGQFQAGIFLGYRF